MKADKIISNDVLMNVRHALYDAKFALESGFIGQDKETVIRTLVTALDATARLRDVNPG